MFCEKCGTQIGDDQRFCSKCVINQVKDKASIGFGILSFFIPLVGLILFLVWKKDAPLKAKFCGIGALIGFIIIWFVPSLFIPFLK
jgi:predicted nucleic acid-binding Zn ribbon protein